MDLMSKQNHKAKIVEKIGDDGKKIYGVRYKDGHVSWFHSLPDAYLAYTKTTYKRTTCKRKRP